MMVKVVLYFSIALFAIIGINVAFNLVSEPSSISNIIGALLFVMVPVLIYKSITFKKKNKDEKK